MQDRNYRLAIAQEDCLGQSCRNRPEQLAAPGIHGPQKVHGRDFQTIAVGPSVERNVIETKCHATLLTYDIYQLVKCLFWIWCMVQYADGIPKVHAGSPDRQLEEVRLYEKAVPSLT